MLTVVQSIYNKNPLISVSTQTSLLALDTLGIEYQYILYNDAGDPDAIKDIPKNILEHKNLEYYYSDFNHGYGVAPGGFTGVIDKIKYPYILQSNQDDFYTPSFFSLSLKNIIALDDSYAAVCSNCFHIDEEFEIIGVSLPTEASGRNELWSNPSQIFDWIFRTNHGPQGPQFIGGDKLSSSNNFILNPGTIYKKELYDTIGLPSIKTFRGSMDFEYWARAVFNGYKFHYLGLPTWSYMKSSYSHTLINKNEDGEDDRFTTYNPLIREKYEYLWKNNNYQVRTKPEKTEDLPFKK